jgi:hypothetical protein
VTPAGSRDDAPVDFYVLILYVFGEKAWPRIFLHTSGMDSADPLSVLLALALVLAISKDEMPLKKKQRRNEKPRSLPGI